jgi:phosphohistidine swiveling domain-containing protein
MLGRGKAAGGGAVVGQLVFSAEQAMQYWNSQQQCILVRPGTGLEEISAFKVRILS